MRVAIILALGFLVVCKAGFLEEENLFQDDFFSMLESDGEAVEGKYDEAEYASKRGNSVLPIVGGQQ